MARFDDLVDEAASVPITGWDFGWLEGRATEERPTWRYFDLVAERAPRVASLLDVETGAGGMLADLPALPPVAVATEGHPPNVALAAPRLRARGAHLVHADAAALPLARGTFELVTSRHPVVPRWDEVARVLRPGGTYLAQHVGPDSLRDLTEHFLGPQLPESTRDPVRERAAAEAAGLVVVDQRVERTRVVFHDIGAVVYFLRLVIWIVPGFRAERHRDQLRVLHDRIERDGGYETTSSRVLVEAVKPRVA